MGYVETPKPTYKKTPRPTKAPKTPRPTKAYKSWPSKKSDGRAYAASGEGIDGLTPLEKVLQAEDTLKVIEEKLRNGEGPEEEGETRLYCDFFTQLLFPYFLWFYLIAFVQT